MSEDGFVLATSLWTVGTSTFVVMSTNMFFAILVLFPINDSIYPFGDNDIII